MSDRVAKIFENSVQHSVVVPGNRVVRSTEVAHVGGRPEPTSPTPTPTIETVSEGNVVRAIDVTCACGQKMRIWCSYDVDADEAGKAEAA